MIVTLDIVQDETGQFDEDHACMILRKIDHATAIVLDYLKLDSDEYEDVDGNNDFPDIVAAAVIQVAKSMYESPDDDPLSAGVKSMLHRSRDPALA